MTRKLTDQEREIIVALREALVDALPAEQGGYASGLASALVRVKGPHITDADIDHMLDKYGDDVHESLLSVVRATALDPVDGEEGAYTLRIPESVAVQGDKGSDEPGGVAAGEVAAEATSGAAAAAAGTADGAEDAGPQAAEGAGGDAKHARARTHAAHGTRGRKRAAAAEEGSDSDNGSEAATDAAGSKPAGKPQKGASGAGSDAGDASKAADSAAPASKPRRTRARKASKDAKAAMDASKAADAAGQDAEADAPADASAPKSRRSRARKAVAPATDADEVAEAAEMGSAAKDASDAEDAPVTNAAAPKAKPRRTRRRKAAADDGAEAREGDEVSDAGAGKAKAPARSKADEGAKADDVARDVDASGEGETGADAGADKDASADATGIEDAPRPGRAWGRGRRARPRQRRQAATEDAPAATDGAASGGGSGEGPATTRLQTSRRATRLADANADAVETPILSEASRPALAAEVADGEGEVRRAAADAGPAVEPVPAQDAMTADVAGQAPQDASDSAARAVTGEAAATEADIDAGSEDATPQPAAESHGTSSHRRGHRGHRGGGRGRSQADGADAQHAGDHADQAAPRGAGKRGGDGSQGHGRPSSGHDLRKIPYVRRGGDDEAHTRQKILSLDQRFWMNGWLLSHPGAYTMFEHELNAINDVLQDGMLPGDITRRQLAYQMGGDEKFFEYGADGFRLLRAMGMEDVVRHRPVPKADLVYHAPRRRKHMRVLVTENLDPYLDVHDIMYEDGRTVICGERIHAVVLGGGTPVLEHNRLALLLDTLGADSLEVLYWGDIDRAGLDLMVRLKAVLGDGYPFAAFTPAYKLMVDKAMARFPDPLDNEATGQVNIEPADPSMLVEGLTDEEAAYACAVIDGCCLIPQEILTKADL